MRLINPDAFMRRLREACKDKATRMIVDKICVFVETEATFHLVEAEPVRRGRWEDNKVAFYLKCSECGATVRKNLYDVFLDCDIRDLNYCPHCGAKMEGVDE